MVRSLGNVMNAEAKSSGESAPCEALRSNGAGVSQGHLIERLVLVTALCFQMKILVPGHEAVDEINRDATFVMVLKRKLMLAANDRKIGRKCKLDLAGTHIHLIDRRECHRGQVELEVAAVLLQLQVGHDVFGIAMLFVPREHTIVVAVDACNHTRSHRNSGHQAHRHMDVSGLDGKDGGLQIFIEAMSQGRHGDQAKQRKRHEQSLHSAPLNFTP